MSGTPNYQVAADSAIVVQYGTIDQATVPGLNSLTLPDYTSDTIKAEEFRKIDVSFAGGQSFGNIQYGGNLVIGDEKGQDYLRKAWLNKTKLTKERFYLNNSHFMTCDLANDPNSGFQVIKVATGSANKSGLYPYSGEMVCNGRIAYFTKHYIDGSSPVMAFVKGTSSEDTITDVPVINIKAGDTIIIEGSPTNDGQYIAKEDQSGTTVTLTCTGTLTSESSVENCAIHGGSI
ncbi:MAG: hypothetical protein GY714_32225 [Desulfobacterales bacterium]|nr:hypothetical protein [Desulfobacterales bacterium]